MKLNPKKFLQTKLICVNRSYSTMLDRKSPNLPIAWSSKVPKSYKCNAIIGELHRSKRISMNVADIKTKFLNAGYPLHFVDSIVKNFISTIDAKDSLMIPPSFLMKVNL